MFKGPFDESILKRARQKGLLEIKIHDLRSWTTDERKTVDDRPYGGGVGMVMMVEPIYRALQELKKSKATRVILLSPRGKVFTQAKAQEMSKHDHLILICGHYEGVDERVSQHLVDEEITIGDYVLTGGELPAMVLIDAITRLVPGVIQKPEATKLESFSQNQLEYPHYTRPENFKGWQVPPVLLSGNHKEIERWRAKEALKITKKNRPDLL